ncbi:MAG: TauD/TfdA family dioxygenase [Pseudomonadota bacterium]
MNITPLGTGFGAVIDGVRLAASGAQLDAQLQAALLEHGLLVIRDHNLTPEQHVQASALFGELETFPPAPGQVAGLPQVFRLASRVNEGHRDVGRHWHSDGSFRAQPTPISIWHSVAVPEQGGDKLFTDLRVPHQATVTTPQFPRVRDRTTITAATAFSKVPATIDVAQFATAQ